jgi:hypothetical protein
LTTGNGGMCNQPSRLSLAKHEIAQRNPRAYRMKISSRVGESQLGPWRPVP